MIRQVPALTILAVCAIGIVLAFAWELAERWRVRALRRIAREAGR